MIGMSKLFVDSHRDFHHSFPPFSKEDNTMVWWCLSIEYLHHPHTKTWGRGWVFGYGGAPSYKKWTPILILGPQIYHYRSTTYFNSFFKKIININF